MHEDILLHGVSLARIDTLLVFLLLNLFIVGIR